MIYLMILFALLLHLFLCFQEFLPDLLPFASLRAGVLCQGHRQCQGQRRCGNTDRQTAAVEHGSQNIPRPR